MSLEISCPTEQKVAYCRRFDFINRASRNSVVYKRRVEREYGVLNEQVVANATTWTATYILGDVVKHNALLFGYTSSFASGRNAQGSCLSDRVGTHRGVR